MNKKIIAKNRTNLISLLLVIVIIISELCLIPSNIQAATTDLEKQNKDTNNRNVKFDSFFVNEDKNVHEVEVTEENANNVNFEVNVEKGYLTNGKIELEDPNFKMKAIDNELISNIENNTINLKDISTIKSFSIPINMDKTDLIKQELLNKETKITLSGTYVNDNGKTSEIKKEIYVKVKWNLNVDFNLLSTITAVIPNGDKTIVQEKITFKENERKSPIEQLKMYLTAPKINDNLPTETRVYANSTKATNGDEFGKDFTTDNYSYDDNTGNIELTVNNNANQNGEIAFYDATDEYIITYVYSQNINEILKEKLNINTYVKAAVKLYSNDTIITKEYNNSYDITEQIGENVTAELYTTDTINKGFLYDTYNETGYNLNYKLNINNKDSNEAITLNTLAPMFRENENAFNTNKIYYKSIAVKEELFKKVLGDDGYINVYDVNGNIIASINKDTEKNNNGELEAVYENVQNNIKIEISKPLVEGSFELRNYKIIDANINYERNQIKAFNGIQEKININGQYEGLLNLNETYTKIDLQMDNTELMPFVANNVNLTLSLVTSSNSYDLFKNPEIRMALPEEVESIDAGEISLVYNDELKFEYARLEENGRVLVLKLTGEETNYKLGIQEGTKIIIPAVIRLKDTVSSKSSSIKLTYSNDLAKATEYSVQGKESTEIPFNIIAKSGLITISEVSGYNDQESKRTLDENTVTGQLEIESTEKTAKLETTLVNNYQSALSNVRIFGKIPFENNTKLNGENLGSTFNTQLMQYMAMNGVTGKIYYSEESNPAENSNSWQEQVENFENVKTYKIVLEDSLATGSELNFAYNIKIPSDLKANKNSYATYTVKYNINDQELENTQVLGFGTPNIANSLATTTNVARADNTINVQITPKLGDTVLEDNSEIHEKEIVNFKIDVTNNSSSSVNNITVDIPVPEGMVYLSENAVHYVDGTYVGPYTEESSKKTIQLAIDALNVNETKTLEYALRAEPLGADEENKTVNLSYTLKINGIEQNTQRQTINVKKAKIKVELSFMKRTYVDNSNKYTYTYRISNLTDTDLNNLTTTIQVPKEIKVTEPYVLENGTDTSIGTTELNDNNLLTIKVDTLKAGKEARIEFLAEVIELNGENPTIEIFGNTFLDNDTYKSNITKNKIETAEVTIIKSSPTENQEVKAWDKITYNIKVTNNSDKISSKITVLDAFPKEIIAEKLEYNRFVNNNVDGKNQVIETDETYDLTQTTSLYDDETEGTDTSGRPKYNKEKNELTIPTVLPAGETVDITITATVGYIEQDTTLTNIASVYGEYITSETSNEVKHYAKGNRSSQTDPDNPDSPNNPDNTYNINGQIWLDSNENGAIDSNETILDGTQIMVVNAATSELVKDSTGANINATSTSTGYSLRGLPAGRYIVIFKYDKNIYKITNYKQEGVSDTLNSKAIPGTATIDGNTEYVGMTDVIEITDSNVNSINMGLIKVGSFDIGIEKTISKIRTVNPKGKEQNYEYKNATKLGKLEVAAKNLVGTTVYIEYNLKVSNLGEQKGYVQELIDELPADLQFDMSLNNGWYQENGKLYYTNINDLEVGQTKDIKLIVTKKLTDNNLGITNNIATVNATSSNDTQDNNLENNKANAQLIIGTSTGRTVINVLGIIVLLAIIGTGIYVIRKYK